jgi:2-succinyl-6-hydroxy-2,4-cyclohexadiene-1-carboxylate synthase
MPLIDVPQARLWYEDTGGDGVPVVFVHPAAASSTTWEQQVPAFVEAGYRCITYDLRGWGKSRQPDPTADPGYLSDDLEALTQALGLGRFLLVAAAYGGMGALDYALRFPDRLRAFVLATSQGAIIDPDYAGIISRIVPAELRAVPIELREVGPSYRAENPAGVQRWLDIIHAAGGETAPRQARFLTLTLALLETLHLPTLVLAADADLLAPPSLMRLLAERIPGSEFAVIADAGHSAHWERPETWNRTVLEFLVRH